MLRPTLSAIAAALLLTACATGNAPPPFSYTPYLQPEGASGVSAKPGWATRKFAVAAANPLATDAGYQVLKAGGSAVDAAVAVQMVLTLVEPQSSGIGGGAFLLHHDGQATEAFDGRETAPAGANENLFMQDGKPLAFSDAAVGGRSVGVPGTVHMLEVAHRQHGRLPWASLFAPAIILAEGGFQVSARLHTLLAAESHLKKDPVAAAYFYDTQGQAWPVGHLLKNPELAMVLRRIASEGAQALSQGDIARAIVHKVQTHPSNPGTLSLADLAHYQAKKREPLCTDYAAAGKTYVLCGMPPPSSGAIAVAQILGMLAHTPAASLRPDGSPQADWLHLYAEAARLAFADRAQYLGDPDFVPAPGGHWRSMVAPSYLAERAQLIQATSTPAVRPGNPGGAKISFGMPAEQPEHGTSHISILDGYGNAVSMTTTIEDAFGARQMVSTSGARSGGFLLNNELTDFNFAPNDAAGLPTANRVQPGKRPRSSMSPTLVFDKATGQVLMSSGSPGGALIIHYSAKTLYAMLHWGYDAQQAINLPNFGVTSPAPSAPLQLEEKRFGAATIDALKARGHSVREQAMTSGLQTIQRTASGYFGGADPRREGLVMGD
jgi:gamma-glutamyltranspeptidase / glutathione hydrolase